MGSHGARAAASGWAGSAGSSDEKAERADAKVSMPLCNQLASILIASGLLTP